jgi:hypothetical protein
MKILILHRNYDLASIRRANINFSFCLVKYARENDYVLHCYNDPITDQIRNGDFDAIILDVSFLALRFHKKTVDFEDLLKKYEFLKHSKAVKIALPQDDYDNSETLSKWLLDWNVNVVFTPCYDYRETIYPSLISKIDFHKSLTGYIDEKDIDILSRYALPFEERTIDIGFRARTLPAYIGRLGQIKSNLSKNFLDSIKNIDIKMNIDVSNRDEDTIMGEDWLKFLGNCRFTLGSESGSSMLDPYGHIREKISNYLRLHSNANFEQVEAACFPCEDKYKFSAVSPRVFEAAIAKSCQILIEGTYLDVLKPQEHYISLKPDFSNIKEVIGKMQDTENVKRMIDNCYKVLIESEEFHYKTFAKQILDVIITHQSKRGLIAKNNDFSSNNDDFYSDNIEPLIDSVIKSAHINGYGYIPAAMNQENITKILNSIYNSYQDKVELMENKIRLRSGKLGAIREFIKINKYLEYKE